MRTSQVAVSVLMAVYNTDFRLVKRAIDSVLGQTFQYFELILVDDGSDGALSKKILEYCDLHSSKITYVKHQNCGQSQSINRAIRLSAGKYIAIIDSDDEYKINHLAACMNEMDSADLISSITETITNSHVDFYVPDKDDHQTDIHVDDCILFATLFGRREVFEKLVFKNMYAADADFYARASAEFVVKKVNLRTYIYYRNIESSLSAVLKRSQIALQ